MSVFKAQNLSKPQFSHLQPPHRIVTQINCGIWLSTVSEFILLFSYMETLSQSINQSISCYLSLSVCYFWILGEEIWLAQFELGGYSWSNDSVAVSVWHGCQKPTSMKWEITEPLWNNKYKPYYTYMQIVLWLIKCKSI